MRSWPTGAAVMSLVLVGAPAEAADAQCRIQAEHSGMIFPVDRLSVDARCLIEPVIDRHGIFEHIGPVQTPISPELYDYLLDHPALTTVLMQRLGMGAFQFMPMGQGRFWVDDGEGARGLLTLLYQDPNNRIYFIDGEHTDVLLPTVHAKTAVFMKLVPAVTAEGRPAVQMSLASYTSLESRLLSAFARIFRPLVQRAVSRTLSRQFHLTNQLGQRIAEDPQRIFQDMPSLPFSKQDDQRMFLALLQAAVRPLPPSPSSAP